MDVGQEKLESLSRDQLRRIEKSMKRPQFMGLLNEYMVEISDPKNKDEYDEYLKQMQREKELPKEMKLIELKVGFCVRSKVVSQSNKRHEMKFFVNVCLSEVIEKATCEAAARGHSWQVPHTVGKVRYDQDRHHSPCQVVDVAFHPDVLFLCQHPPFQEMVIGIALDAAEKQLGERKETLSRDYVLLKHLKCKGDKPALLPVRLVQGKLCNKGDQRDLEGRETKLQQDLNKQKEDYEQNKALQPTQTDAKEEGGGEDPESAVVELQQGIERPKYNTILSYSVDYSQFIGDVKSLPTHLNVEFKVPRVQSAEQIKGQKLQINDRQIVLEIGNKYFIDLSFAQLKIKHKLVVGDAKAKYDKKKQRLRIIIPIERVQQQLKSTKQQNQLQPIAQDIQSIKEEKQAQEDEHCQTLVHQQQTWKHKVLQFSQPNTATAILNEIQQTIPPPLIEQIDEDDFEDKNIVDNQDHLKETLFSVQPYNKQKKDKPTVILYKIYENKERIIINWRIKGSKRQEIKCTSITNNEWIVQSVNHEYSHIKIKEDFNQQISKIECRIHIGFASLIVFKREDKVWGNNFVIELLSDSITQGQLQKMKTLIEQAQRKSYKQQQKQGKNEEIKNDIQTNLNQLDGLQTVQKQIQQNKRQQHITHNQLQKQPYLLNVEGQAQFIEFNVPLIQQLE